MTTFESDNYHDLEITFHRCFVCNEKIGEYYYQQFKSGLQVVCAFCYEQKKNYIRVTKELEAING